MARSRPVVATVFGVLNVAFGGLGLLAWLWPTVGAVFTSTHEDGGATHGSWWVASHLGRLIPVGLLALSGVGLLTLKPWARLVSIGYSVFAVSANAASSAVLLAAPGSLAGAGALGAARVLVGLLYPVALLAFMLHPSVGAALREACEADASGRP